MNIPGNTALSDEAYAAQMERVDKLLDRWTSLLGFNDWHVTAEYSRIPLAHEGNHLSKATDVVAATCSADWRYMHMLLRFDAEELATIKDEQLEFRVVHELMHAALNECRQPDVSSQSDQYDWLDHEEHAATFLAKAFLRTVGAAYHAGEKDAGTTEQQPTMPIPRLKATCPDCLTTWTLEPGVSMPSQCSCGGLRVFSSELA